MKVGDLVRPHPGIRHPWTKRCPNPWVGVIIKLHTKVPASAGSRQAAVVCWNHPGFQAESRWAHELEVVNESR